MQGRSAGPWEHGDGAGGSTLHWVYMGVGARPATLFYGGSGGMI